MYSKLLIYKQTQMVLTHLGDLRERTYQLDESNRLPD
jgi:hypothetical protein